MTRCVIHVGMRKTGSTSIQQSLNGFSGKTFIYADINGHPNHGGALYSLFADDPGKLSTHRSRRSASEIDEYVQNAKGGLERSIERAYGKTVIYSGEACSYLFSRDELSRLRDYFLRRFQQVDIVAYIRPPAAYMGSNFQQRVKVAANKLDLHRDYFPYRNNFSKFDELFGRENVQLWKFEPASFPGGCVVRDFCARLNIDVPADRIVRANESLSRQVVALLYTYRKLGKDAGSTTMTGPQNLRLTRKLMGIGDAKFRISPDMVRPILERNRADIEWMEARLGQSLREELDEHRPGDVRVESDLLKPDPESVKKLLALLGDQAPAGVTGEKPEQVALLVHALRGERAPARGVDEGKIIARRHPTASTGGTPVKHGDAQMNVVELLEQMKQANPKLLDAVPEQQAADLIQQVFTHMNTTLTGAAEGMIEFAGLGRFRVRKVEREVEGKKIARTQIGFRPAKPHKSRGKGRRAGRATDDES